MSKPQPFEAIRAQVETRITGDDDTVTVTCWNEAGEARAFRLPLNKAEGVANLILHGTARAAATKKFNEADGKGAAH